MEEEMSLDARMKVYRPELEEGEERVQERLKPLINELLYANLPPSCTLADMETAALDIFERVMQEWRRALEAPPAWVANVHRYGNSAEQ